MRSIYLYEEECKMKETACAFTGHRPISVKIIMTTGEKYGILAAWKS